MPTRKQSNSKTQSKKPKAKRVAKLSPLVKPENLSNEEWQRGLRIQIAGQTDFNIKSTDTQSVYTDYIVTNKLAGTAYRVAFRSNHSYGNFCECLDFKTNRMGMCKHLAAVIQFIERKPVLKRKLKQPYEALYSSLFIDYLGEPRVRLRIGIDQQAAMKKLFSPYIDKEAYLQLSGFLAIDKLLKKAKMLQPDFICYPDALSHMLLWREANSRKEILQPFAKRKKLPPIKSFKAKPFPYQVEGILFAAMAGRSLLADDMGLGKTLQAIGVAQLMYEYFKVRKVLIVCPTSLKYQWENEIRKFTHAKSRVIEGHYLTRRGLYQQDDTPLYTIISYNMAVNDVGFINDFQPDLIILDEGQRIKNYQTKVAAALKKLQSRFALILTGTPLENKLTELYSLLQFVDPVRTGSLFHLLNRHELKDDGGKLIGYKDLHLIRENLKDVLIRRTKNEVLKQLPERTDSFHFVDLTQEQADIHQECLDIVAKIVHKWRKYRFLSEQDRQRLMNNLSMMRMVCNSTFIIDQKTNHQTKLTELVCLLQQIFEGGNEKVVIFSQWERFTRLIALELETMNIGFANLHGSIPSHKRKDLFEQFNENPDCRVFLSTDAGGVGLNLQAGSYVINMDLPWNPAVLEQRIARVHRHGQTNPVQVINFVAKNTIEEKMISKLKFKSALAKGILDDGEQSIFMDDAKFNSLVNQVDELIKDAPANTDNLAREQEADILEPMGGETASATPAEIYPQHHETESTTAQHNATHVVDDLLHSASGFMNRLHSVFNNPEALDTLADAITEKDKETGRVYLKIPVEHEQSIKQTLQLLAGLLNLGKS